MAADAITLAAGESFDGGAQHVEQHDGGHDHGDLRGAVLDRGCEPVDDAGDAWAIN